MKFITLSRYCEVHGDDDLIELNTSAFTYQRISESSLWPAYSYV